MKPEEIRKLRQDSGLTKANFARLFGVSPTTITLWETGDRNPPQIYVANMIKMRERISKPSEDVTSTLMTFLVAGGILAFVSWLFAEKERTKKP